MKKFLALTLSLAMALSLAACGGSGSGSASSAPAASSGVSSSAGDAGSSTGSTSTPAELTTVEAGKLIMSTNAAFPPYEMTDDSGNVVGIDAEIAGAIADKLGLELVIDDMDFRRRPAGGPAGQERHLHGRPVRHRGPPAGHGLL